jgi:hypothetical protein
MMDFQQTKEYEIFFDDGSKTTVSAASRRDACSKLGYDSHTDAERYDAYLPEGISHVAGPNDRKYKWCYINNSYYYRWVPVHNGPIMGKYDMSFIILGRLLCRVYENAIPNAGVLYKNVCTGKWQAQDPVRNIAKKFVVYLLENELVNGDYGERWTNGLAWKYAKENPHIVAWVFL